MIFGKFPIGEAGKFLVYRGGCRFRGALKSRGGAEDFDEFCKNVIEKLSNIQYILSNFSFL